MKRITLFLLSLMFCFSIYGKDKVKKPFVIPEIKEWKASTGYFNLNKKSQLQFNLKENTKKTVNLFQEDLKKMFDLNLSVNKKRGNTNAILFKLEKGYSNQKEKYSINITKDKITIKSSSNLGLYWGTRTLLQLFEQSKERKIECGEIIDYPDYSLRGFMIDCGRKYIPISYLRKYIEIMSYYKMNTLQIHLNDNGFNKDGGKHWDEIYSAFRLECETYPGLTAKDGHYSKKEFIELQKFAKEKSVEIIPEIDSPAHALAFSKYMPEIGSEKYGKDHLDLFNPKTYEFMDKLFDEYLKGENPVFIGDKVHIGTDEYSNKNQDVVEKFRYYTDRYIKYIEKYGKQACIWGALTHAKGSTPVKSENVIMGAWYNGYANPADMIKKGYDLISIPDGWLYIVPAAGYYNDYLNIKAIYNKWTPAHIGKAVFKEKHPSILGGMFAVWNDHIGNGISVKDIHDRSFPAVQTLATKMWTGASTSFTFEDFDKKRKGLSEGPNINIAGKIGNKKELIFTRKRIKPNTTLPFEEIGYNYTISFDYETSENSQKTPLFESEHAKFYLFSPKNGEIGFERDGYLNTFGYKIATNQKINIKIKGDNKGTQLFINNKLVKDLKIKTIHYGKNNKYKKHYVSTLVFPLKKIGAFDGKISNLRIYNY